MLTAKAMSLAVTGDASARSACIACFYGLNVLRYESAAQEGDDDVDSTRKRSQLLSSIVQSSCMLEDVKLEALTDPVCELGREPFLRTIFTSRALVTSLAKLVNLELHCFKANGDSIVRFFKDMGKTIKTVNLDRISVCEGGQWSNVLRELRRHQFLVLEVFCLQCCDTWEDDMYIDEYINGLVDKDPLEEYREKDSMAAT